MICMWGPIHLYVSFPFYDISLLSNCKCQSDYRHASLRRHRQGLSNRPSTVVFGLRRSEHPLLSPHQLSLGFQCNTLTDSFPSLIFTFPTYLRWVTSNVKAWATCGCITPPYTSKLYGALPQPAITFALHCTLLLSP